MSCEPHQLRVAAPAPRQPGDRNPYTWLLYKAMSGRMQVREPRVRDTLFNPPDVWHFHWPENAIQGRNLAFTLARASGLIAWLLLARLRQVRLVWTIHNRGSHERPYPRVEKAVLRACARLVNGWISLTEAAVPLLETELPTLANKPRCVIPHGHYRPVVEPLCQSRVAARRELGLPAAPTFLFIGQIRPYKGVESLLRAHTEGWPDAASAPTVVLAGKVRSGELLRRLENRVRQRPCFVLTDRWLSSEEVALHLSAASLVVLPYWNVLNSGAALLSLSAGRPVLLPRTSVFEELQGQVSRRWLRLFNPPLKGEELAAALRWAAEDRPQKPDLSHHCWEEIGARHAAFFQRLRDGP